MRHFKAPKKMLAGLDAGTIAHLVTACADVALILDRNGVIRDLAVDEAELKGFGCGAWVGQPFVDIVTPESRAKAEAMLAAVASGEVATRWRQMNHPGGGSPGAPGEDLPVNYFPVWLGAEGRLVVLGRDLRPLSVLQQRFVTAQARMERECERLRATQTRYQTLFQLSAEAVLVLDASTLKITEANPAATRILAHGAGRLLGRAFLDLLAPESLAATQVLLGELRVSARAKEVVVRVGEGGQALSLSAAMFRHDKAASYLLRLAPIGGAEAIQRDSVSGALLDVIAAMPDGFVVIDEGRRILMANAAFLELAQLAGEEQARGEPVARWLGRVEVDIDVLVANLREYGLARRFPTMLRGEFGAREDVELSGVAVLGGDKPCYGLTIRRISQPAAGTAVHAPMMPRSLEQLKELVGRVPLRELVREATDIIEQMCIEAALELTGDNRASAAEMLGLSRQSLYVKLRRHGLGELDGSEPA